MTTQSIFLAIVLLTFIIAQIGVIWYLRHRNTSSKTLAKRKSALIEKEFSKQIGEE